MNSYHQNWVPYVRTQDLSRQRLPGLGTAGTATRMPRTDCLLAGTLPRCLACRFMESLTRPQTPALPPSNPSSPRGTERFPQPLAGRHQQSRLSSRITARQRRPICPCCGRVIVAGCSYRSHNLIRPIGAGPISPTSHPTTGSTTSSALPLLTRNTCTWRGLSVACALILGRLCAIPCDPVSFPVPDRLCVVCGLHGSSLGLPTCLCCQP